MNSKCWQSSLLTILFLTPTACGNSSSQSAADGGLAETGGTDGSDNDNGNEGGGSAIDTGDGGGDGDGDPGDGDGGDGIGDTTPDDSGDGDGDGNSGDGDGESGDGDGDPGDGDGGPGDGDPGDGDGDGDANDGGSGDGGSGDGGSGDGDGDGNIESEVIVDPQCAETYYVLNLADRNIDFNDGDGNIEWCDRNNSSKVDPQWQGLGWYRLMDAAGTQIPNDPPEYHACGTAAPGWMVEDHPAIIDGVVGATICFSWANNTCLWQEQIQVVHCDGYYLYRLPNASTCSLRYCGTD
jgi:hypothetical protein